MSNIILENPPLSILSIVNDFKRLNDIIEDKNKTIDSLQLELSSKDEQMQKLLDKNVELSLKIVSMHGRNEKVNFKIGEE